MMRHPLCLLLAAVAIVATLSRAAAAQPPPSEEEYDAAAREAYERAERIDDRLSRARGGAERGLVYFGEAQRATDEAYDRSERLEQRYDEHEYELRDMAAEQRRSTDVGAIVASVLGGATATGGIAYGLMRLLGRRREDEDTPPRHARGASGGSGRTTRRRASTALGAATAAAYDPRRSDDGWALPLGDGLDGAPAPRNGAASANASRG